MTELTDLMDGHRATLHPLFAYLHTHLTDDTAWEYFVAQYVTVVWEAPRYFALLRERLPLTEREIFDHLVESTAPETLLLPPGLVPRTDGVSADPEILPAVIECMRYHRTSMTFGPLPTALGICYAHCHQPDWIATMDQLIAPYLARLDLIRGGVSAALNVRALMWDEIYDFILDTPF